MLTFGTLAIGLHRLTAVSTVTCDGNATCSGAACTCNTNFYGTGYSCARA